MTDLIPPSPELKCSFVAIIGQPNAGKSTLVNTLVGSKVTIVSPKAQTTRMRVMGVMVEAETQVVLMDTPGIFAPKKRLEKAMVKAAWESSADSDMRIVIVDAKSRFIEEAEAIIAQGTRGDSRVILVLNKIDLVPKERLLELATVLGNLPGVVRTFMISALHGSGVQDLKKFLIDQTPVGMWHFPADQLSDLPQRLLAAEITREHLFRRIHEEIPYALTVDTELWEEFKNGSIKITQAITVGRENHKKIILGKGGQQIKTIGALARHEMTEIFETPVHLFLHVRVDEKWDERRDYYHGLGLTYDS